MISTVYTDLSNFIPLILSKMILLSFVTPIFWVCLFINFIEIRNMALEGSEFKTCAGVGRGVWLRVKSHDLMLVAMLRCQQPKNLGLRFSTLFKGTKSMGFSLINHQHPKPYRR